MSFGARTRDLSLDLSDLELDVDNIRQDILRQVTEGLQSILSKHPPYLQDGDHSDDDIILNLFIEEIDFADDNSPSWTFSLWDVLFGSYCTPETRNIDGSDEDCKRITLGYAAALRRMAEQVERSVTQSSQPHPTAGPTDPAPSDP